MPICSYMRTSGICRQPRRGYAVADSSTSSALRRVTYVDAHNLYVYANREHSRCQLAFVRAFLEFFWNL